MILYLLLFFMAGCSSCRERAEWIDVPQKALAQAIDQVADDPHFAVNEPLPEDWWRLYNDSQLSYFIELALYQNPSLAKARDLVLAAAYEADRICGQLYPQISWEADVQREKLSTTGVIPFPSPQGNTTNVPIGSNSMIPIYFTQYETAVNFSYDFDIWGKRRAAVAAAVSEMQAAKADEAYRRLALSILVAETYFQLQIALQREQIGIALVDNLRAQVEIARLRVLRHLEDETFLLDAQDKGSRAEERLVLLQGNIEALRHFLLALIAGNFEEEIDRVSIQKADLPAVPIPCSFPLHLIASRPDIISQLWIIGSYRKQIQIAKAEFYPDFNLVGFIGFQTIHWRKLFNYDSLYGDIEPAVNLPLFRGGSLVAGLRESEVNYDIAIDDYNELVLQAVNEVLDGITNLQSVSQAYFMAENQERKQREIRDLTAMKEKTNLASMWDVLNREASLLTASDHKVEALEKTLRASLDLIKALGGGYQDDCFAKR